MYIGVKDLAIVEYRAVKTFAILVSESEIFAILYKGWAENFFCCIGEI